MGRSGATLLLAATLAVGCAGRGELRGNRFVKEDVRYRLGPLPPAWRQIQLEENDLAFISPGSTHSLAINATCQGHGDAPLEVLTRHLLMGFTGKQRLGEARRMLDGREAYHTHYMARLDGVPVELVLVVLKKDGCVYDFTYLSPPGRVEEHRTSFEALLAGFHAEARR